MTAASNESGSDQATGHPADGHVGVSAGEVLSDRELRPSGAAGPAVSPDVQPPPSPRDRNPSHDESTRRTARPGAAEPADATREDAPSDDLDVEQVAADAIDYFSDDLDDGSPAADADAPAPPG